MGPAPLFAAEEPATEAEDTELATVIAKHLEARGGAERWREVEALELTGSYAAFSERSDFRLVHTRGDRYRLEFEMLGGAAIRARDAEGPWGRHQLLKPETGRIDEGPYKTQYERESLFGPLLLDYAERGIEVKLLGPGEVDGIDTVDLEVTLPGDQKEPDQNETGQKEIWHLDAETYLEVAVDSEVFDFTQLPKPMQQRTFYDDFREVDGLVIPHQIEMEFGARLETMSVERVVVDPEVDTAYLSPPPAAAAPETEAETEAGAEGEAEAEPDSEPQADDG